MSSDPFFAQSGDSSEGPISSGRPPRGRGSSRGRGLSDSRGRGVSRGGGGGAPRGGRGRGRGEARSARGARGGRGNGRATFGGSTRGRGAKTFSPKEAKESDDGHSEVDEIARPVKRLRRDPLVRTNKPKLKAVEKDDTPPETVSIFDKDALDLSSHPLPKYDDLVGTLAQFKHLHKLNLSSVEANEDHPKGLDSLEWLQKAVVKSKSAARKASQMNDAAPGARDQWFGHELTSLTLAGNRALGEAHKEEADAVFNAVTAFPTLFALDLSHLSLHTVPLVVLQNSLRALVLTGNELTALPTLPYLPNLNTLIVSKNKITSLSSTLPTSVPAIKKLSLANNDLLNGTDLPDFSICGDLREVRLSGNPRLASLPTHLPSWGKGREGSAPGLDLLDLGRCGFADWDSLEPLMVLGRSSVGKRGLRNLNLQGNPIADSDDPEEEAEFKDKILSCHTALRTLNNTHVGKKGERSAKADAAGDENASPPPSHQSTAGQKRKREEDEVSATKKDENSQAARQEKDLGKHKRGARGGKAKKSGQAEADHDDGKSELEREPEVADDVQSDSEDEATEAKRHAMAEVLALGEDNDDDEDGVEAQDAHQVVDLATERQETGWVEKSFGAKNKKEQKKDWRHQKKGKAEKAKANKAGEPTNLLAGDASSSKAPSTKPKPEEDKPDSSKQDRNSAVVGVVDVRKKHKTKKQPANGVVPKPQTTQFGLGGGDAWGGGQSSW